MKEKGKKSNSVPFSKPRRYTIFSNDSNQEVLSSVCDTGCRGKFKSKNGDDSHRMRSQSMPSNMSEYLSKSVTPSESMDKVVESNESLIDVEEEEDNFDVYNIESALPNMDWDTLEQQLQQAADFEKRKKEVTIFLKSNSSSILTIQQKIG